MKTLVRFFALFLMAVLLFSCVKEEYVETGRRIELTAQMEVDADSLPGTKTHLEWGYAYYPVVWDWEDEIAVYDEVSSDPQLFTLTSGGYQETGTFAGTAKGNNFIGFYPFHMAGKMSNGSIPLELPKVQNYVAGSFGRGNFPMMATGDKEFLKFRNLCALMKLSLKGTGSVVSITVKSNDKEAKLSGRATAKMGSDGIPQLTMLEGGSDTVVLDCGVVDLKQDNATDFYIVIPAQTYNGGLEISVNGYMDTVRHNIPADVVFERSEMRGKELAITLQGGSYLEQILAKERAALIEFYNSTNGDNWTNNTNWCSDKPVGEWYGVTTDEQGRVKALNLRTNSLSGTLPESIGNLLLLEVLDLFRNNHISGFILESIGNLIKLRSLWLGGNSFEGPIDFICKLKNLEELELRKNKFTGNIPQDICSLKNLERINMTGNFLTGNIPNDIGNLTKLYILQLGDNYLFGSIPESITRLNNLTVFSLGDNMLSGKIPEAVYKLKFWKYKWSQILGNNKFSFDDFQLYGIDDRITCLNGKIIDLGEEYKNNKYTILYTWDSFNGSLCDEHGPLLDQLKYIYEKYSNKGVKIISWSLTDWYTKETLTEYVKQNGMEWDVFLYGHGENEFEYQFVNWISVVDSTGRIVYSGYFDKEKLLNLNGHFIDLLEKDFKSDELSGLYKSTDFSSDGKVKVFQKATKGKGIDLVLMGDGYSDRLIADGTYDRTMQIAYDKIFEKEPYKTYKDYFNVFSVYAVSKNEVYVDGSSTALECSFVEGETRIFGNDKYALVYAAKAIDFNKLENATILVALNSKRYAGTCNVSIPSVEYRDWAEGTTISFVPVGNDEENFGYVIHHEVCGHGFAKLADEYAYESYGPIDDHSKEHLVNESALYGWWKNVDLTGDPAQVKWKKFLQDSRYANEGLGVFEGAHTYWKGVWKPSETSIMVYNTGEFNAPSREAIYYRIHKLAYGPDWEYDYEKFVEYDAINRNKPQTKAPLVLDPQKNFRPTAPPVVVKMDLRELMNQGK